MIRIHDFFFFFKLKNCDGGAMIVVLFGAVVARWDVGLDGGVGGWRSSRGR